MTVLPSSFSPEALTEAAAGLRTAARQRAGELGRALRRSDAVRLAVGLAASGTALALLLVGCALLLVEVVTPALAEVARPLGITF